MLDYKQLNFEAVKGRLGNFSKMVSSTISILIKILFKRINFHGWIQLFKHNICTVCQSMNDVRYLNSLQLLSSKRCTSQRNHDHFFLFCRRKNTYLTKFVLYSAVFGSIVRISIVVDIVIHLKGFWVCLESYVGIYVVNESELYPSLILLIKGNTAIQRLNYF